MNVRYTCMIVIMIMQRIMTCYMHINLSLLTFVVMWNWSGNGTMYECTLHMYDSHNDYAKNNDMLHAH